MPEKPVPDHVWSLVLPWLRLPVPEALSRPLRSDIRQQDLTSLCRVSKLLNEICQPLLYGIIITDDLPKLLSHIHLPANRKLFGVTHKLYVEYSQKDDMPSYATLRREGKTAWDECGLGQEGMAERAWGKCEREIAALTACLQSVNALQSGKLFPNLRTLAVASLYGSNITKQHYPYLPYETPRMRALRDTIGPCSIEFHNFLHYLSLSHLCIRDNRAPLSFPGLFLTSKYNPPWPTPITTLHLPVKPLDFPIFTGLPIRYTVDQAHDSLDFAYILKWLETSIWQSSRMRRPRRDGTRFGRKVDVADLHIYCSTGLYRSAMFNPTKDGFGIDGPGKGDTDTELSVELQAAMVKAMGKSVQERLREDSGVEDKVVWQRSNETSSCGACGSGAVAGDWDL